MEIYKDFIDDYFKELEYISIQDVELKLIDKYYIDNSQSKYIFACKYFDSKDNLQEEWEKAMDKDIALFLQNTKYSLSDIRWDIYFLILYSGEPLSYDEISSIERDKFCCKKLIIDVTSKDKFISEMKIKTCLTKEYFLLQDNWKITTEDEFISKLNENVRFQGSVFINKELLDPDNSNEKEKLVEILRNARLQKE
jgi:hypothetical protein